MKKEEIEKIFRENKLSKVDSIEKIEIGFTNEVYLINGKFILKVCEDKDNEINFDKEVFFYSFFKKKLSVPKIKVYDNSKKIYNRFYMIYPKIEGDNVYSKWHLLNNKEREKIVKQLCEILRVINNSSSDKFAKKFEIDSSINWQEKILAKIQKSLSKVEKRKLLSVDLIKSIKDFVNANKYALKEQKVALVYWDVHFDNILIQGDKIVGILDFERTELASIDFVLNVVRRMVDYPKKYMSEDFEKFARKEDYAQLLDWFKEFYPELFEFEDLNKRLDLYALEHDLNTLLDWPDAKELKGMIAKTVGCDLK